MLAGFEGMVRLGDGGVLQCGSGHLMALLIAAAAARKPIVK